MYELVEILTTLSGEAPIPGLPVLLLRFRGCNLHCTYCDTPGREDLNYHLSEEELRSRIRESCRAYPGLKILLTGGEPLLGGRQEQLRDLMADLPELDFYLETNGSVKITDGSLPNSHFVMDWKTPSSGEAGSFCRDNLPLLQAERDCIKFVVNQTDFDYVREKLALLRELNPRLPVYLSPQAQSATLKEVAAFILNNKLAAGLSIQLHKQIWVNEAKGI